MRGARGNGPEKQRRPLNNPNRKPEAPPVEQEVIIYRRVSRFIERFMW